MITNFVYLKSRNPLFVFWLFVKTNTLQQTNCGKMPTEKLFFYPILGSTSLGSQAKQQPSKTAAFKYEEVKLYTQTLIK